MPNEGEEKLTTTCASDTSNFPTTTTYSTPRINRYLSAANRGKFALIDTSCARQFEQQINCGKLSDECLNTNELNNNNNNNCSTLILEGSPTPTQAFRIMDSKRKSGSGASSSAGNASDETLKPLSKDPNEGGAVTVNSTNPIPSYSSIFTSSYRRSSSPSRPKANSARAANKNGPLRKQLAQTDSGEMSQQVATTGRQLSGKRIILPQSAFNYLDGLRVFERGEIGRNYGDNHNDDHSKVNENDDDDESENDEDDNYDDNDDYDEELNERSPFNSSVKKQSRRSPNYTNRCVSPESQNKSPSPGKLAFEHRCDPSGDQLHHYCDHNHNPQTKISFNDSRPPSFNLCHVNSYDHHPAHQHEAFVGNRKGPEWQQSTQMCINCNGDTCQRAPGKSVLMLDNNCHRSVSTYPIVTKQDYSRTRSLHLALKSIILIMLTLLLLMLFVGIILASHYLPQVFDRFLNASRSFNVTIAG